MINGWLEKVTVRILVVAATISIVALLFLSFPKVYAADYGEAASAITNAETSLREAFMKVADAESVGAKVDTLAIRLSEAGEVLTLATPELNLGNYENATYYAGYCQNLSESVSLDADMQRQGAIVNVSNWWIKVVISAIGSAVLVTSLFFVWLKFKQSYKNKLMKRKPEVNEDVEPLKL